MIVRRKLTVLLLLIAALAAVFVLNGSKEAFLNIEKYYTNNIDGYVFAVPESFFVDESFYPQTVRFVSESSVIELYAQPCNDDDAVLSYINYTNSAITSNTVDYSDIRQFKKGNNTILFWSRNKLSRIENDKNNYLKIDIPRNKAVYTLLVKASCKINNYRKYLELIAFTKPSGNEHRPPAVKYSSDRNFNSETREFYDRYFRKSNNVEWGIYQWDYMKSNNLDTIESRIEHKFKLLLLYSEFNIEYEPQDVRAFLDAAYSDGRVVELTLQPKRNHAAGNDLFRVLDGYYDTFLHAYAEDVAGFSHPVIFRLCNEMNGDWCEYSGYRMSLDTELYREMYRYIYDIFRHHNANNVIWVWNPNGKSFPDFKWNSEEMYYPGDGYVDILGLTLYNTGDFYAGEHWTEFNDLYSPLYEKAARQYDMPFMITEFSCAREGGDKEQWTRKMLGEIKNYPNIKFAVWWNGADFTSELQVSRSYYINDSEQMLDIFKNYFAKQLTGID